MHRAVEDATHHGCRAPEKEYDANLRLVPAGLEGCHNSNVGAAEAVTAPAATAKTAATRAVNHVKLWMTLCRRPAPR